MTSIIMKSSNVSDSHIESGGEQIKQVIRDDDGKWEGDQKKRRRPRTVFTGSQLVALESVYQSQRLLCKCERARLAGALSLTPAQVKVLSLFSHRNFSFCLFSVMKVRI